MDAAEQPEPTHAVEGDLSTRFTSSLALPSHDEADSPALLLSQDEHRPDAAATQDDRDAEQNQRRQELKQYLELMRTRQGSNNTSETQTRFGLDFYNLVQQLSQEQKAEYASIRGWLPTPSRLAMPVPLASPSDDSRVQEGLRQILQLDERLMKKSAQAALVARETFPEAWEAQDRKQAERDEKQLLQSLERERLRQQRSNRLASAVEALEDDAGPDTDASLSLAGHFKNALLSPEDEQLLEKLLEQDEQNAWQENPFECDASHTAEGSSEVASQSKLAVIDAKLEAFQAEDLWNQTQRSMSNRPGNHCEYLEPRPTTSSSSQSKLTTTDSYCEGRTAEQALHEMLLSDSEDYLTARRQAKHLATIVEDIDARLRRLQTAELPKAPTQEQMVLLIDFCRRQINQQESVGVGVTHSCSSTLVPC